MQWCEHSLTGQFHEVKPAGRSYKEKFMDWILDDADFNDYPLKGGAAEAQRQLKKVNFEHYGKTRNYLDGAVSMLSPYIEHGLIDPTEILKYIDTVSDREVAYVFLKQLSWRDFYAKRYRQNPESIWKDLDHYKTGFAASDYQKEMPQDILDANTNVAVINQFIKELQENGYLHNHARLYLSSYIVHWRRVKWQTGARWMLQYLLDGNLASNNYSWQWVASTGSHKPYIFNLDNIKKFAYDAYNTNPEDNKAIAATYPELMIKLFPKLKR